MRPDPLPHRSLRRGAPALLGVVALALALALTACGTSGRTLRDPVPGATAPPRKGASTTATTAGAAIDSTPVAGLSISSTGWTPGSELPIGYTCDGQNVSPPLTISGAPVGTAELVLVVTDQDQAGFVHWVVAGIPPGAPSFPQGGLPAGAVQVPNSEGNPVWLGPCPPSGTTHVYDFTVYALALPSRLGPTSTMDQVDQVVAGALSTAAMTGLYTAA